LICEEVQLGSVWELSTCQISKLQLRKFKTSAICSWEKTNKKKFSVSFTSLVIW
jgi:hypothetical protein